MHSPNFNRWLSFASAFSSQNTMMQIGLKRGEMPANNVLNILV